MPTRKTTYENRKFAKEHDHMFSMEQVEDVLDLIANEKWPDGNYSDDECNLWSLIREKLNINF